MKSINNDRFGNSFWIYAPANLLLAPPPPPIRHHCFLLASLLYEKWCSWDTDPGGWTPLNTAIMHRAFGRPKLRSMFRWLECKRFIEIDRRYVPGKNSRKYRLRPEHRICRPTILKNAELLRRLVAAQCRKLPVHDWLENWLNRLDLDASLARQIISTLNPRADSNPKRSKYSRNEYRRILLAQVGKWDHDRERLVRDKFGRVHTVFTRLPRELRCGVSFTGERLVGLDLSNSQPFFLGCLALRYYSSKDARTKLRHQKFCRDTDPHSYQSIQAISDLTPQLLANGIRRGRRTQVVVQEDVAHSGAHVLEEKLPSPPPVLCSLSSRLESTIPVDVLEYLRRCESGALYETLGERAAVKRDMMKIVFDRRTYRSAIETIFRRKFPSISAMLDDLKRNNRQRNKRHAHVAHLTQNLEATMFIGKICRRAMREYREMPIVTLHDGLFTTEPFVDLLHSLIVEEFQKIGFSPKIKLESCID